MPYVFDVPTTLDALHDLIGKYAKSGKEVSLIIDRIYKANSVRLDHRNKEKMQNFYDVLLRRFVAVGDAIYKSGNGGSELSRYCQLDELTRILYAMAQDSADLAGAVWSRRLGFFQSAHTKRLRDAVWERTGDDSEADGELYSAWPSTGVILVLRALGHIFPVTDKRHPVVSPAILFLGQIIAYTPILSVHDLVAGIMCCALLLEYTKEAKRFAPEAHAFLACVIRLYAHHGNDRSIPYQLPTFCNCSRIEALASLRSTVSNCDILENEVPQISLESDKISDAGVPAAILYSALHLVESSANNLSNGLSRAERELFAGITANVLCLQPRAKSSALPIVLQAKVASVAAKLSVCCSWDSARHPLQRRAGHRSANESAIPSLAPRIENPERYSVTQKDKGKSAVQAAADRSRREYKREHKAVARELRLDGAALEQERRRDQDKKDADAKAKRQKAFAWLEGEQAAMNQQVRQGGGLLQGGGMGAAKAKARSGKFGIKKGGKLR
jgi:nucleolar protein 14